MINFMLQFVVQFVLAAHGMGDIIVVAAHGMGDIVPYVASLPF